MKTEPTHQQQAGRDVPHREPPVPTGPDEAWGGQDLKRAVVGASAWLTRNIDSLNALNVFPVPDGDTGTNMSLTMQAAIKEVADSPSHSCTEIAHGISHGALMGARGNSGVILSQIWRGFADGLGGKEQISAHDFAEAMVAATATAYRAVLKPVEGTILTVMRETGEAARDAANTVNSFGHLLNEAARGAKASVARTPRLLDKLREAGVVDAGGEGLYVIIDGMRRYAEGENLETEEVVGAEGAAMLEPGAVHVEHGEYGYCTNFILVGGGWDFEEVRTRIASLGESAVIVGDDHIVKAHIHTETPGTVLNYATSLGSLRQVSITDMQAQHEDFLEMHASGAVAAAAEPGDAVSAIRMSGRDTETEATAGAIAILAVASGPGLVKAFKSMGATGIIEGGQTMNPSTQDIIKAVERVPQNEVIVLPNNKNIIMSARQAESLTKKHLAVVPTETIPQGMSALIAFNYEASLEDNLDAMREACSNVATGEVTRAVRDARVNGLSVKEGEIIGLLNNNLVTKGASRDDVAWDLLGRMDAASREIITLYWGGEVSEEAARAFYEQVQARYSNAEAELVSGGQPFYDYIISVE